MAEGERVPGSTAGFACGSADSDVVRQARKKRLAEVFSRLLREGRASVDGRIDFVWSHSRLPKGVLVFSGDSGWAIELKPVSEAELRMEVPDDLSGAFPDSDERQLALPGLDDLGAAEMEASDRALLVSAAVLEGLGVEVLSSVTDRVAELMSATEVPIRDLRNPGKVLGELAEKGEIARVTNHGKIVGWLMPATEAEQHLDALLKQGRLRRGTPEPIEPIDVEGLEKPLSEVLTDARDRERT
ncbi:hypothetical protein ABZ502_30010 [Streptomyces abikoensis]|uniref:hypothetical protein n=1 Tax=Streptomyces abikoensis TaxID=97398 RepID=UPI0033FA67B7